MKCPSCEHPAQKPVKVCPECGEAYATEDLLTLSQLEFLLKETAAWGVAETLRFPYSERLEALRVRLERRVPVAPEVAVEVTPVPELAAVYMHPSGAFSMNRFGSLWLEHHRYAVFRGDDAEIIAFYADVYVKLVEEALADIAEGLLRQYVVERGLAGKLYAHSEQAEIFKDGYLVWFDYEKGYGELYVTQAGEVIYGMILVTDDYSKVEDTWHATLDSFRIAPELEVAIEVEPVPAPPTIAEPDVVAEVPPIAAPPPPLPEEVAPPVPAPKPVAVPKPRPPLIDWGKAKDKLIEAAVSGALLRGLLYLGAFMFVVSAHILLVRFRAVLPAPVQLAFLAVGPGSAYVAGWGLRSRLKLPQAGGVLTAIGALLVAVDLAGIYQFGGLTVDVTLYWAVASAICTVTYALTAWRLPMEFFGYITLLGAGSTLLALARVLALPLEWQVASLTALTMAMVESAARLERAADTWGDLARAARRLPQILVPVGLGVVLFDSATSLPSNPTLGHAATFAFAALSYGLSAWRFPAALFGYAAMLTSVGAAGFALWAVALPLEWYATAAAAFAPLYILAGRWLEQRLGDAFAPRRAYVIAANVAGFVLVGVAVLAGFVTSVAYLWPGVLGLTLAALVLAGCAYLLRRPILVLPAAALFLAPYSLAVYRWFSDFNVPHPIAWLMTAWAGLALAYLGLAVLLRTAEQYGVWLNLVAHALTPLASLGLLVNFQYTRTADSWIAGPTLAALGGVILVYVASAVIHDSGRHPALSDHIKRLVPAEFGQAVFVWPVGLLLPVWLVVAWWSSVLHPPWLGAVLAGLGLAYVGLGQLVKRRKAEYRLPVHVYAYVLGVVAILLAIGDAWPLLTSLYIVVGVLAALALVYRRVWETAAAALLFIWPFQLSLALSPLTLHLYSLAFALLASLAYIPLAVALDKAERKLALPVYATGYGLSAYAIIISLLGRFGVYPLNLPWVGVAVPLIASGLQVFGLYRLRQVLFAWTAPLAFAIAFAQTLSLLRVPPDYHAAAWVGLAFVYVLTERALAHRTPSGEAAWSRELRLPLGVGGTTFCVLGLLLTAQATTVAFTGGLIENYSSLLLAQTLAVLLTGLAAWLYRSHWPLYLEPWLAFFPVTLFFIGYGASLFGRALTPQQFALTWSGLAIVQVLAAVWLDRYKVRYAHGPYLAGYLLAVLAVLWSAPDRVANLYTLGATIVLAGASHALVHYGRHYSFDDFIRVIWRKPDTIAQRTARTGFLLFAAYVFPIWLARLMAHYQVPLAWSGLVLALVAPLYIALGLALRRVRAEYAWPLYSAGYALTAIGAMVTFQDEKLAIWVLGLNAVVYAASAYVFRRPFWLYLSNILVPIVALLTLHYNFQALPAPWVAGIFMVLAFLYFGAGQWFDWRERRSALKEGLADFAVPFYTLGYLLSAVALAAASGDKFLALGIYSAGVLLYALSAWVFRESIFLYPAAWLAAVPYFLGMTLMPLPRAWYGLGWLPLVTLYIALGRFVFQRAPYGVKNLRTLSAALTDPAMPFYLLAYALSVSMIALSQGDPLALVLALLAGAAVYFASAALFRIPAWLYPGLVAANLALLAYLAVRPSGRPIFSMTPPFLVMTWAMALAGYWLSRRFPVARRSGKRELVLPGLPGGRQIGPRQLDFRTPPFVGYLVTPSWAQPLFVLAAFGLVFWQALALPSFETAVLLGTGHAVLLGLFAMLWQDAALAYGTLAYSLLAVGYRGRRAGLSFADALASVGGIGFGLYWVARIAERAVAGAKSKVSALGVWPTPLTNAAIVFSTVAVIGTLPMVRTHTTATAAGLAFAGALYLAIAYQRRYYPLGYLGMPMIIGAWALALLVRDIRELQLYAIPVGLYLTGVGFLERRRARRPFAIVIESFGLSVLLLTSFVQSLNGVQGFPYFALLLIEALLVIWWGASRLLKAPFLIGLGASVLNVVAQIVVVVVSVRDVRRWFLIAGVSLVLLIAGILAERHRERLIARSQEMFEEVMTWD